MPNPPTVRGPGETLLLRRAAHRAMPWKNGAGTTWELAREPAEGDYDWRVSIARVAADGAFSRFAGYQRHTLLLDGHGFELSGPGGERLALRSPGDCIQYDGAAEWHCRLAAGPCHDLNLIARRGSPARLESLALAGGQWQGAGATGAPRLLVAIGAAAIESAAGAFGLAPWDALWLPAGLEARARQAGDAAGLVAIATLP